MTLMVFLAAIFAFIVAALAFMTAILTITVAVFAFMDAAFAFKVAILTIIIAFFITKMGIMPRIMPILLLFTTFINSAAHFLPSYHLYRTALRLLPYRSYRTILHDQQVCLF